MSPVLRFLTGLWCAVLLLGWTSAASSGLISFCEGNGHEPCGHGHYHAWLPGESGCCEDHHDAASVTDTASSSQAGPVLTAAPAGCPSDHRHSAVSLEMNLPSGMAMLVPQWYEFSAVPLPPPTGYSGNLPAGIAAIPEPVPPGPPPLHEACAPLLI